MSDSTSNKPLILISNDDGITAPGIQALISVMKELGEVIVVAPDKPQSAMGHAITINQTIRLTEVHMYEGVRAFQCSGTPVDCVKLAIDKVLDGRKPNLMVSGINHGSNASINVIYSGTMSAAVEAAIDGMPAIGFSLCDYRWEADFESIKPYIKQIAHETLKRGLPYGTLLNVNIPVPKEGNKSKASKFAVKLKPNGRKTLTPAKILLDARTIG